MFGLFLFWISQFKDVFTKRLFFIRIFRVLNTVQSFIFKVQFFVSRLSLSKQLIYYINLIRFCQALFYFVLKLFNFLVVCVSTATFISYHVVADLSISFLFFSDLLFWSVPLFSGARIIISHPQTNVKHFFTFFWLSCFFFFSC